MIYNGIMLDYCVSVWIPNIKALTIPSSVHHVTDMFIEQNKVVAVNFAVSQSQQNYGAGARQKQAKRVIMSL